MSHTECPVELELKPRAFSFHYTNGGDRFHHYAHWNSPLQVQGRGTRPAQATGYPGTQNQSLSLSLSRHLSVSISVSLPSLHAPYSQASCPTRLEVWPPATLVSHPNSQGTKRTAVSLSPSRVLLANLGPHTPALG